VTFRDAHTHLSAGAVDLSEVDLRDARSAGEITRLVSAAATARATGWIRGWGWDGAAIPEDAVAGRPVFLARKDGHGAWLNGEARSALGMPQDTAIVEESRFDAARRALPERGDDERAAALRARAAEIAACGVVAVDDMVEPWGPAIYARLAASGELPIAVRMWLPEEIPQLEAERLLREFPFEDPRIAVAGIKVFLDGSLAARTAALGSPYADAPGQTGELRIPEREISERLGRWAHRGWPVAVHAIGDRAVSFALDVLSRLPRPKRGAHRIEHAQVVKRSDLPRFAAAGIVASVQPRHWSDDLGFLAARLGDRPGVVAHPLRSLARHGARLVFGSDWPVSSFRPAEVLASATDPARGDEALDPGSAAAWYTSGPP
jgi:predicted amidohydrolase YtcJ